MSINVEYSHAFQPIVDIQDRRVVSYEVLLRGKNDEPPGVIFGKISKQHFMAFDQASRERAIKLAASLGLKSSLNLNFTPGSVLFENGKYVESTVAFAKTQGLEVNQVILEITESEIINKPNELVNVLNKLRRKGVAIAIDDFGAGYAGLNLLSDMQPDLIKLDMHLIRDIDKNGPRQSIVRAISSVCLDLGIDVLAEGVETKEEFGFLKQQGIALYQGYLFAKPGFECLPSVSSEYVEDECVPTVL